MSAEDAAEKATATGEGAPAATEARATPATFLRTVVGRPCIVKLNSGVEYRGEF